MCPYFLVNNWIISGIIVLYIPFPPFINLKIIVIIFPTLGFKYIRKFHWYKLRKYIRDLEQSSKDKIPSPAQNWWTLHVVIFPMLYILMIPMFITIRTNPWAHSFKNGLHNEVKECFVRNYDKQTI